MFSFFAWYLLVSLLGWLTFPLAYRLFPALADRGFSLARTLGMLIWGYVFWMMASLGVIQNDSGGLLLALALLIVLSIFAGWKTIVNRQSSIFNWLKSNLRLVVTIEVLFFLAFAAWAFVRASNPNIETAGGEKTMELAFINAILRSPTFPPHDPWLSGYAISYYYFGYVMTAMLAKVTGTIGSVAHNLMTALIYSLSVIGAYGLLYNLLAAWRKHQPSMAKQPPSTGLPLLAPLFLLVVGNLDGFLEILYRRGLFWKWYPDGTAVSFFWHWLNLSELQDPPLRPLGWLPNRPTWNLLWQAARLIQDCSLANSCGPVIDEAPVFSFFQGDLHPHVLAIPFGLLAISITLNLFLGGWHGETKLAGLRVFIQPLGLLISALVLGGLAFMNTWDILPFTTLFLGTFLLRMIRTRGWAWERLEETFAAAVPVGILSILLYLPFFASFGSDAGGILPNLISPTRGAHLWLMFGALLVPIFAYLIYLWRGEHFAPNWFAGIGLAIGLSLLLWGVSWLLGALALKLQPGYASGYLLSQGFMDTGWFFAAATWRRLAYIGGWITQAALLALVFAFLARTIESKRHKENDTEGDSAGPGTVPRSLNIHWFVLLLILIGALLILAPDYVYLRDMYGNRGNTVFKFYFQGWILWSTSAAFGTALMLQNLNGVWKWVYRLGIGLVLAMGLCFFAYGLPYDTKNFQIDTFRQNLEIAHATGNPAPLRTAATLTWTLDGARLFQSQYPDDAAAAFWLANAPDGVVAEAVGGSYSDYARMAAYSGLPDVFGWPDHEHLWHGIMALQGTRQKDIPILYQTSNWEDARTILERYEIRYVVVGTLERQSYHINEQKFQQHLTPVFQQGQVVIYEVP
jgi:YYY domain-containing protein